MGTGTGVLTGASTASPRRGAALWAAAPPTPPVSLLRLLAEAPAQLWGTGPQAPQQHGPCVDRSRGGSDRRS